MDEAGVLGLAPAERIPVGRAVFRAFPDEPTAKRALTETNAIRGYFLVTRDYLDTGRVLAHSRERASLGPWDGRDELSKLLRERLVGAQLEPRVSKRVIEPIVGRETYRVSPDGRVEREAKEAFIGRLVLPLGFVFLLFTSILMSGSYLIQATATEKENKVVEVLLSSASADEIMTGKLLGLGGAGLFQVMVWLSHDPRGSLRFRRAPRAAQRAGLVAGRGHRPVLFIAAYAFLGSLMLGTGLLRRQRAREPAARDALGAVSPRCR